MAKPKKNPEDYIKPMPTSVTSNPLHGINKPKIEIYGLQKEIIEMKKAGNSLKAIVDEMNTKYLTEENQFISVNSLSRWLRANMEDYEKYDQRNNQEVDISEYQEYLQMVEYCDLQLETCEIALHDLKKQAKENKCPIPAKDVTNLMNCNQKTLAQKQALLAAITSMKDRMINWKLTFDIVNIILEKVKERDLVLFSEIVNIVKSDPLMNQVFQSMKTKK